MLKRRFLAGFSLTILIISLSFLRASEIAIGEMEDLSTMKEESRKMEEEFKKEWKEEKRLKFNENRKLWVEKYKIFKEQELMEAEDKK